MIELVRKKIKDHIRTAHNPHPGLFLQKGLIQIEGDQSSSTEGQNPKSKHIEKLCQLPVQDRYRNAFKRWLAFTDNKKQFRRAAFNVESRLLIGLSGTGALETGCAINHCYGMPYIPGSSIKGAIRAWAREHLGKQSDVIRQLLGGTDDEQLPDLSGVVNIYDAWWIPEPGDSPPFSQDVITCHHPDYYANSGAKPASDLDSPVPNALIGVDGSFFFVVQGRPEYTNSIFSIMENALGENGIGAKKKAGYGFMSLNNQWNMEHILAGEELLQVTARILEEKLKKEVLSYEKKEIINIFSKDYTATQKRSDFESFIEVVRECCHDLIEELPDLWMNSQDKNLVKKYKRAYKNLSNGSAKK